LNDIDGTVSKDQRFGDVNCADRIGDGGCAELMGCMVAESMAVGIQTQLRPPPRLLLLLPLLPWL
jgi:hypothetical protein